MHCLAFGWDITASAPAISALAAVLAGFVFTSIVFLIGTEGWRYAGTLGLFCAACTILGFGSLLYGILSGFSTDTHCSEIWGQGLIATGPFTVGVIAVMTGVTWLLSKRVEQDMSEKKVTALHDLNGILLTIVYGGICGAAVMLGTMVYSYLSILKFPGSAPSSELFWVTMPPAAVAALSGVLGVLRWKRTIRLQKRTIHLQNVNSLISETSLHIAPYGITAYAAVSVILDGVQTNTPQIWSANPAIVWVIISISLVIPLLLFVILIHAKPPFAVVNR